VTDEDEAKRGAARFALLDEVFDVRRGHLVELFVRVGVEGREVIERGSTRDVLAGPAGCRL